MAKRYRYWLLAALLLLLAAGGLLWLFTSARKGDAPAANARFVSAQREEKTMAAIVRVEQPAPDTNGHAGAQHPEKEVYYQNGSARDEQRGGGL